MRCCAVGKTSLYLLCFCVYSAILLIIGKTSLGGGRTPGDYFLAGRSSGLVLCVGTFTGTWVSAITILSLTGSVYEDGLAVLCYSVIPWFLGALLLGMVTRRLYACDCITVPELFRIRYGSKALQAVYGVILTVVYIFYLVSQYKGFGTVASAIFDIPYPMAVLMVYLFILYTTFGGFRSVCRTDVFNLTLLVSVLLVFCLHIVSRTGGLGELYRQVGTISGSAHAGDLDPTVPGEMLSLFNSRYTPLVSLTMFWGWGLGLAANPQYLVRLLAAKDSRTAERTLVCSLALLAVIYFCLIHIGLGMRVLVPSVPEVNTTDGIVIHLVNNELYGPLSCLFFFAVIGACISTANSQLLLVASSVAYDVVRPLSRRPLSDSRVVNLGRVAVVVGATIGMILTLNPPAFTLSYGGDLWGVFSILLFPPLYGTLLFKKTTLQGIWASIGTGVLSVLIFYPLHSAGILRIHPAFSGVLLSAAALTAVSLCTAGKEKSQ